MPKVDTHLIKFSNLSTVLLSGLAFILNQPIITAITAGILALSALISPIGPYRLFYRFILVPLHILQPRIVEDDPAPHRFAQGVGAVFLTASSLVLFLTSNTWLGWGLDITVFVLAGINFTVGFCAGCFVYYHLGRIGLMPRVRYDGGFRWRGA
jgi:hypothetical protein